jgi:SAM-dependent methyltransferase
MTNSQDVLDQSNAAFWSELCGSGLARAVGVTDASPTSLQRFDHAYLAFYPYLTHYVPDGLYGKRVLEIGLGYGTLGQLLAERAGRYHGVDIAWEPAAMMRHRLRQTRAARGAAVQASVLDLPFGDGEFDYVFSIGCLHHTGNLARSISEIRRVLARGGQAIVMLYHRHSFRRLVQARLAYVRRMVSSGRRPRNLAEFVRGLYDADAAGAAAPHTDFVSRRAARGLFRDFSEVAVETRNFDGYVLARGRIVIPREWLLGTLGRVLGLDLYIVATK